MAAYRKRKPSARALNSGLGVQRLLMGGSSLSGMGGGGDTQINNGPGSEHPDHLTSLEQCLCRKSHEPPAKENEH